MPVTFVNNNNMPDQVTGLLYPNHAQALAYQPISTFRQQSATSTGVFPDQSLAGSNIADAFHVHQIALAGVVTRVCVSFLKGGTHVSWIFYWPDANTSSRFNRTVRGATDQVILTKADEVAGEFIDACATTPAIAANDAIAEHLNKAAQLSALLEQKEEEKKQQAVPVSSSARDQKLFSAPVSTANTPRKADEVEAILKRYPVKFGTGEEVMVRRALMLGYPKESWNKFIAKYYDGLFPATQ